MDDYKISIHDRIRELILGEGEYLGPNDFLSYSWDHGYERMEYKMSGCGSSSYGGAYHPDGCCWNGRNTSDDNNDGTGICVYCGRTLM